MKINPYSYWALPIIACITAVSFFSGCNGSSSDSGEAPNITIQPPAAVVAGNLLSSTGATVNADVLKDKDLTAFYFSASWCPPCRAFTPGLVEFAEKNKDKLAVILVSADRSADLQQKYIDDYKMPFYALRHNSPPTDTLNTAFGVRFIPTLVVVDRNGNVVSTDGVAAVRNDPNRAMQNWLAQAR